MTYDPNIPNGGQSPGLFPAQANTNFTRLQALIAGNHVFNDTAAANDGAHTIAAWTATDADPTGPLPAGTISQSYSRVSTVAAAGQLKHFDGTHNYQLTPDTGTVNITSSFTTILAVPANVYGTIYLYKDLVIQQGVFVSNGTVVNGYSFSEKFETGSGASQILRLAFDSDASGLDLRVRNDSGSSYNGVWTYKILYGTK